MFQRGPVALRILQHLRPYICPFEEVLRHIPAGSRVLDVGCGGGLLLGLMRHAGVLKLEPGAGVGFDLSKDAIVIAQQMAATVGAGDQLKFQAIGVEDPWPDGQFDVVSIVDVMHHVPANARRSVLQHAFEHLRPGGRLVYKDMTHRGWRAFMNQLHDLTLTREWITYTPAETVEHWASQIGFTMVHASHHKRWWYGHDLRVLEKPAP